MENVVILWFWSQQLEHWEMPLKEVTGEVIGGTGMPVKNDIFGQEQVNIWTPALVYDHPFPIHLWEQRKDWRYF